jgi:proprotein convertase subtilisin/kexin type 5
MSNCLNCTAYNTCTACQTSYSLYNFQCISVCPISTISITNNLTLQSVCVNCPSNCLTCSIANSSMCLTCNSGYYLSNGACGISCVLPLYLSWNGLCSTCQTQCLTCSTYSYNCTSCSALLNLYLYKFQCLGACPSGTYPASNICVVCPTNCSVCSSAGYCSICTLPSALYVLNGSSSSCVATCPNGTTTTINTTSLKYQC